MALVGIPIFPSRADKSALPRNRVTARPQQVVGECATPTTTTTVLATPPLGIKCHQVCVAPISACAAGEPTGPVTTATLTAADLCTVTLSVGIPFLCGGCATCTSGLVRATAPTPVPLTTDVGVNPGGPIVGLSSLLDGLTSILTIVKRDEIITQGHGGGPILTATETPSVIVKRDYQITEGHRGGPIVLASEIPSNVHKRDYKITEGRGGGPIIGVTEIPSVIKRDYQITEGHRGGPIITATETSSPKPLV